MTLHVSQRLLSCRAVFDRFDSGLAKAATESKTIGVRVGAQWFEAQAAQHQSELRELFDKFQCKQLGRTADGYLIFEQLPVTTCGAGGEASTRQSASCSAGAGGSGTGSSSAPTGPGTPSPGGSTSGAAPSSHGAQSQQALSSDPAKQAQQAFAVCSSLDCAAHHLVDQHSPRQHEAEAWAFVETSRKLEREHARCSLTPDDSGFAESAMQFNTKQAIPILRQKATFEVDVHCNVCMHEDGLVCVSLVGLHGTLIPAQGDSAVADAPARSKARHFFSRQKAGGVDIKGGLRLRKLGVQLLLLDQDHKEVYSEVHVAPALYEERKATVAADRYKHKEGFKLKSPVLDFDVGSETNPQASRQHSAVKRCLEATDSILASRPPPATNTAALTLWRDRVACDDEDIQPADRSDCGWAAACKLGWQQRMHGGTVAFLQTGPTALCHADGRPRCTRDGQARKPASLLVVVHAHAMAFDLIGGVWCSGNEEVVKMWDWLKIEQ